jgi:hypothetical protein
MGDGQVTPVTGRIGSWPKADGHVYFDGDAVSQAD